MKQVGMSVAEFCRVASLGKTTAFGLIRDEKIASTRVGGRRIINVESAMELLAPKKEEE